MHFTLNDGEFVIFFPVDVHAPMIGEDEIKKMAIKVKNNSLRIYHLII